MTGETIPAAFAAQVRQHPDRPAVLTEDAVVTYRQLAAAVAATAATVGPARGGQAALLCRHGVNTVTALLAALVAGRAYVPLEPTFPARRLAHILADSAADVLLVDAAHAEQAEQLVKLVDRPGLRVVEVAGLGDAPELDAVLAALASPAAPDDPAYVLYTSGSTGAPKGVVQSHRNVLFGIANQVRNFAITPGDRTSVLTSFGYDMAVTDTFGAILSGAAAVPVDIRTHGLGHLARALARHRVTIYHSTPTVYRYLCASLGPTGTLPDIRAVLLGGEEVTRHDVELARRHFTPDTVFVNGYGTTEISFAAQYHLPADAALDRTVVPVGYPLDGIEVLLLDEAGVAGDTGEVVVRCPHVALGYWRLPELTAQRFGERDGVRTYRTGDIARRLPDGRLEFLGRADRLVKIRGYRVELGEIEVQLAALPGVGQAAVVARPRAGAPASTEKEIIGYVVPTPADRDSATQCGLDPAALRTALAASLPDFMVPRAVVVVDALPMGTTGKLDVAALPAPPQSGTEGVAADPVEHAVAAIWAEVLGVAHVDRDTSFTELGGHSLLLALVQERLETGFGHRVPLARLFELSTVATLAAYLRTVGTPANAAHDVGAVDAPAAAPGDDAGLARVAGRMRRRREARTGDRR
ncbi:non-ribosomal peptide synthetase [Micromonospora eburnea]|uniref:Amino acid adenylation domain-containing protein n=1 Tax=Micromonospora eburnea TaxID=227316 RepID=A0A1C6UXT2_9ACTN|nr:non-ribosomal peptide synthetase [Micromonospora eburnea]SCL58873.1 amino acid adenylation domain-containing protein [Micromonospora eburnea]